MKLDIGNPRKRPDWVTVDIYGTPDIYHDLRRFPWPFDDNTAGAVLMSHVLEHFTRIDGMAVVNECRRILKPGGTLYIAVPDMDRFIDAKNGEPGDWDAVNGYGWKSLDTLLGGDDSERVPEMRHKYLYCFASLAFTLLQAGFVGIVRRRPEEFDNPAYHGISLYIGAVK